MKKILWILIVACAGAANAAAQQRVRSLLPVIRAEHFPLPSAENGGGLYGYSSMASNGFSLPDEEQPDSTFERIDALRVLRADIRSSLLDSLIAAFDADALNADESDRYVRRTAAGDTLSYTIANGLHSAPEPRVLAKLDVFRDRVSFSFAETAADRCVEPYDASPLDSLFQRAKALPGATVTPVSYRTQKGFRGMSFMFGYQGGIGSRSGERLWIPASEAEAVDRAMRRLASSYGESRQRHSVYVQSWQVSIGLGRWQEAYCTARARDGSLYFVRVKADPGSTIMLPSRWWEVDILDDDSGD